MPAGDAEILVELNDGIAQLILNRPESRNAISKQMWLQIPERLNELQKQGARLLVIKGVSGVFAAGADMMELKELDNFEDAKENWSAISNALDFVHRFPLPTIASIDGPCMGGGCLLALACDLRYASRRSRFSIPIARLGIVLDDANLFRLANLVGVARAKELIYRARILDASEALSWGLLNDLFDDHDFAEKLSALASEILSNSALSVSESKTSFQRFIAQSSMASNEKVVLASYLSPDFRERIRKLLQKD
ncbi:MAG: enoyl-CoA hydratase/isomerase family protein [Candidatus Obscuribacterales bacterium]|nr:enoyl-CoA hydratase/isomerase family protein [Candidatus Obscuribacterales bacterium]